MTLYPYIQRWHLIPDGEAIHTHSSDLLPVRYGGRAAMLKIARSQEEQTGNTVMVWWSGKGAARVFEHDAEAVLLEWVEGDHFLTEMVAAGRDDGATQILCRAAGTLHENGVRPWPELPPLERWFRGLEKRAPGVGGVMALALETAQRLFREPQDLRVLHGDVHHGNVLHSRERGWLAIDPKGLIGERAFDFANILCNPSLEVARRPGRLERQASIIAETAGLDRIRLLEWAVAYAGLSAAWHLEGEELAQAGATLEVARIAAAELHR